MGPHQTTVLLVILCVILLASNLLAIKMLRSAIQLIVRYDAILEEYGGLGMALSNLTRRQVLGLAASSAFGVGALMRCDSEEQQGPTEKLRTPVVYDRSASDVNGGESSSALNAAAASMLLSLNGIEVAEDDLYISLLVASSADEVADAINPYVPIDKSAVALHDVSLLYLPGPSIVWIDGKPVIFVYADEAEARAWEVADAGLEAPTKYGFSEFERKYDNSGRMAVYLVGRGYEPVT